MSRKHFDKETRLKYVKVNLEHGIIHAVIHFLDEFEDRYIDTWLGAPKGKAKYKNPVTLSTAIINSWTTKSKFTWRGRFN